MQGVIILPNVADTLDKPQDHVQTQSFGQYSKITPQNTYMWNSKHMVSNFDYVLPLSVLIVANIHQPCMQVSEANKLLMLKAGEMLCLPIILTSDTI